MRYKGYSDGGLIAALAVGLVGTLVTGYIFGYAFSQGARAAGCLPTASCTTPVYR